MSNNTVVKPRTKVRLKTQRPPLYKVILLNDDYTPREFVVLVLKAVFRMNADQAYRVMMTAHRRGACVIAVYTRDVAETKAKEATELGAIVIRAAIWVGAAGMTLAFLPVFLSPVRSLRHVPDADEPEVPPGEGEMLSGPGLTSPPPPADDRV